MRSAACAPVPASPATLAAPPVLAAARGASLGAWRAPPDESATRGARRRHSRVRRRAHVLTCSRVRAQDYWVKKTEDVDKDAIAAVLDEWGWSVTVYDDAEVEDAAAVWP